MACAAPAKLIVALTGATGSIFGIRILQVLREAGIESHLVLSQWGIRTLLQETSFTIEEVKKLAAFTYHERDLGAAISSGSFTTDGMIVAPCSMRTLSAIACGQGATLVHRAADVILKERRRLVLVVRESPFNTIHLENMLKLSRMGAIIIPPVPAFYNHPRTINDIVDHIVMRILDQLGIHLDLAKRWEGTISPGGGSAAEEM